MDLQFVVDVPQVEADGVYGDAELVRGGLVMVAVHEVSQKPQFMRREVISGIDGIAGLEMLNYPASNLGGHGSAAADCLAKAVEQLRGRRSFDQITARAGAESIEDTFLVLEDR